MEYFISLCCIGKFEVFKHYFWEEVLQLPSFLKKFKDQALKWIEQKCIGEVIFSEGTYEVEIVDKKKKTSYWPFLQVDEKGNLIDAFCSCSSSDTDAGCSHLAAAFLTIIKDGLPLHKLFKDSFFNHLFEAISFRLGFDAKALKKQKEKYVAFSETKKKLLSMEPLNAKTKKKLKQILAQAKIELPESSLKFSNLSTEEIEMWRARQASSNLKYKLSFWVDIAQLLFMLQQEGKKYKITFTSKGKELPHLIKISFSDIAIEAYISDVMWVKLAPYLNSIDSPLKVFDYDEQGIEEITFDEQALVFHIKKRKTKDLKEKKGIDVNGWTFVAGEGFYAKSMKQLFKTSTIEKDKISEALSANKKVIEKYLNNAALHVDPIKAKYHLYFDKNENFHIDLYVKEKGDLKKEGSHIFDSWVYIKDDGFYEIEDTFFSGKEKIIPKEEMSQFITRHRIWLHSFEGFQTHFGQIQSYLTYHVNDDGNLHFDSKIDFPEGYESFIDLGEWVYIQHIGFYAKKMQGLFLPFKAGLKVEKDDVDSFISSNLEELEQVPSFFTSLCPLKKVGIEVRLNEDDKIQIIPKRFLAEGISVEDLIFYERYIYIKNVGFFCLPHAYLLPEKYRMFQVLYKREESYFLKVELAKIKSYITYLDPRLKKPQNLVVKIKRITQEKRRATLSYLVDLIYESELGLVHGTELYTALKENKKYIFSKAGLIYLNDPRFNWLKHIKKTSFLKQDHKLRLNSLEWIRLCLFEDVQEPKGKTKEDEETRKLLQDLKNFETHELIDLSLLKAKLRPYQEVGVKWLWFLYCHGLSGLLCDDMGLGKTHQAMSLMAAISKQDADRANKYLVICPTSVIYHWQELLKQFLPHLRVLTYHGTFREMDNFEENYDLLLTSYGIYRSDQEIMQQMSFEIAVFDEIQIAKNHLSKTHVALRSVRSKMRLGLTGTPIENNLRELKAVFDLVLANYLPSEAAFREYFILPIEKHKDDERQKMLSKLIKPFILRRKKAQVLLDLPEKIEELSYCDLSEEQKGLYIEILKSSKERVLKDLKNKSKAVPYIHVFALLSKLKQVCDHPCLILKDKKVYHKHHSGKWDLFVELLSEARDSNQKVVVFSQYLGMLAIIESYLKKKGIGFATIKGSTRNRAEELRRFKDDPRCEVFVGSLLAAGVGIELSAASVVIHYDRWWNPAKENQATDRVHRIGQSRGVQVFKLVAKNTIEEHIHKLIERKKGLIEKMIGKDDVDQIKTLSRDELINLFYQMEEQVTE